MGSETSIWIAATLVITGVAVLRISWGKPTRSMALNLAGWGALLLSLVVSGLSSGAWGIAVAVLITTFAAFVALAFAAAKPARKVRAKAVRTRHQGSEDDSVVQRSGMLTFAITGPLALVASLLLALAMRAMIFAAGGAEADGNVAVLATVPLAWPILSFALLMMSRRASQITWVVGVAAVSTPFLLLQGSPA